jgi:hypothetical protein
MDNINEMIQVRFKIPFQSTGKYLCIPFISASNLIFILVFSTIIFSYCLQKLNKKKLILLSGFLGIFSHSLIFVLPNIVDTSDSANNNISFLLFISFLFFGIGLGSYYSLLYPLVGHLV